MAGFYALILCWLFLEHFPHVVNSGYPLKGKGVGNRNNVYEYGFGDLNLLQLDAAALNNQTVLCMKEDRYSQGRFLLTFWHSVKIFAQGHPIESLLGTDGKDEIGFRDGNASVARFSAVSDLLQYNKTRLALNDQLNRCIREYDFETGLVRTLIGKCAANNQTKHGRLNHREVIPASTDFLSSVTSMVLVESENYFLLCDFGYSQITRVDVETGNVRLLLSPKNLLLNPTSLLLGPKDTNLYVSHFHGVAKIDLQTLEIVYLVFQNMDSKAVRGFQNLKWLILEYLMVGADSQTGSLAVINLRQNYIRGICYDMSRREVMTGDYSRCQSITVTAMTASNSTIYLSPLRSNFFYNSRLSGANISLFTINTDLIQKSEVTKKVKRDTSPLKGSQSVYTKPCPTCQTHLELDTLQRVTPDEGEFSTGPINVIKEDRYRPGTFYYGYLHTLRRLIPGHPSELVIGPPGNSSTAAFSMISDFIQYNKTQMLIADYFHACVQNYDMTTHEVTKLVGHCTPSMKESTGVHSIIRNMEVNVTDNFMSGVLSIALLESRNILLICDQSYQEIYEHKLGTTKARLFAPKAKAKLPRPKYILANIAETELFVSHAYGLSRVSIESREVTRLVGSTVADDGETYIPFAVGSFKYGAIGSVETLMWLVQDELLVAVGTKSNEAILFLDLRGEELYSACAGSDNSNITIGGSLDKCELNSPSTLAVTSNGDIYIVVKEDGSTPKSDIFHSNSSIFKISTQRSICSFDRSAGREQAKPNRTTFHQYEIISIECPKEMGLNSKEKTVQCQAGNSWNITIPQCKKITSANYIESISPKSGQLSGGTMVTIAGLVPDIGGRVYLDSSPGGLVHLPFTVGGRMYTFRMPSQSSLGPVELIVELTKSIRKTFTFSYLKDPVIKQTNSYSTIVSGGIELVFDILHMNSSSNYSLTAIYTLTRNHFLRTDYQGYKISCNRKRKTLACMTKDFPGLDGIEAPRNTHMKLFSDGVKVGNESEIPTMLIYPDPQVNASVITLPYNAPLIIYGNHLDVGDLKKQYEISISLSGGKEIECVDLNITNTQIACRPDLRNLPMDQEPKKVNVRLGNINNTLVTVVFQKRPLSSGAIGGITAAALVLVVGGAICITLGLKKYRKAIQIGRYLPLDFLQQHHQLDNWIDIINPDLRTSLETLRIESDHLTLARGDPIAEGNFGKIFLGTLGCGTLARTVAVKTLKERLPSTATIEKFIEEALMLQNLHHVNVLLSLGICIPNPEKPPQIVFPYMENGDLKSLIQRTDMLFTIGDLMHFAKQISNGMEYLSDRKFIHRDLAARNCLVSKAYIVKISDFGLSKDVYCKGYYKRGEGSTVPLPVKWMALESLGSKAVFTSQSDVWSFGVLMWELLTRGSRPYSSVNAWDMRSYLETGRRLTRPANCPSAIYRVMKSCWVKDVEDRPTFAQMHEFLSNLLEGTDYHPQQLASYVRNYTKDIQI